MTRAFVLASAVLTLVAWPATSQTTSQLWNNVTIDWVKSERVTYELDIEPKITWSPPAGQPEWWNLDREEDFHTQDNIINLRVKRVF